ncbi:hypothetical protein [Niallia sp. FSL R7-0271]|uniref:hypothetical protein n=1 Tax=Niallia sp. FSL R7-0271 TaxID=2921678 RepID=UPI0030F9F001
MNDHIIFFIIGAFVLLILIPFFIIRDIKNGKNLTDIFTSNMKFLLLMLIFVGEVLRSILSTESMNYFNQTLFLFCMMFGVTPAIFLMVYHLKNDIKKLSNPKEYKHYWVYKIRYILITLQISLLIIGK